MATKKHLIFIFIILILNPLINTSFQLSLFNHLNSKYQEKNLIISPLSIYQAISLVTNGAVGQTQKELLTFLDNKEMEEINSINLRILNKIQHNSALEIANAIMSKLSPLYDFTQIAKKNFNSEILPLKSAKQINKWCDKKTHGKINHIIDELDPLTYMIILNAVYFKGEWVYHFNKDLTKKETFYNQNKFESKVDMMEITKHFKYFSDSNLQSIELPFIKETITALIILPNKNIGINEFIELLSKDNEYLYTIADNMKTSKVNLRLPKFELTYNKSLKDVLKSMGINLPFDVNADFSNIRRQNDIFINDIIHKTYLKVNEDGTEAAAVTMVEMMFNSFMPREEKIIDMEVNRPFLFILRNDRLPKNYDIIFISKIEEIK